MKIGKWFAACVVVVFCIFFAAVCFAELPPKQSPPDDKAPGGVTPQFFVQPQVKSMTGRVKSFDPKKNSFQFTPNNVGLPIEITCKEKNESCNVSTLTIGLDVGVKAYYEKEKWWAVSVERKK